MGREPGEALVITSTLCSLVIRSTSRAGLPDTSPRLHCALTSMERPTRSTPSSTDSWISAHSQSWLLETLRVARTSPASPSRHAPGSAST